MRLILEKMVQKVHGALSGEKPVSVSKDELLPEVKRLHIIAEGEVYRTIGSFEKHEIKEAYAHDPWWQNYLVNLWEYSKGQDVLESYPWNVSLPLADLCNARCTFCDSWLRGEGVMKLGELERFIEVLRYARVIGIQGHGEPLANPELEAILSRVNEVVDGRALAYVITNGAFLEKKLDRLLGSRVLKVYNISLNATTAATHHTVMGLGEQVYGSIVTAIRRLTEVRDKDDPAVDVSISMVLTRQNIQEASAFVRLGNELGVNRIYLRTLMPIAPPQAVSTWDEAGWDTAVLMPLGLNYNLLPPYLHPDFDSLAKGLRQEISNSVVPIDAHADTWAHPIFSQDVAEFMDRKKPTFIQREEALADKNIRMAYKSARQEVHGRGEFVEETVNEGPNPYGRGAHFLCRFVYHNLNCNEVGYRIVPCCYMAEVPGYRSVVFDGSGNFMDYWNSPAFVKLRHRLRCGPLFDPCKTCPNQG